ncbi:MAG: hypothetical protein ACT4QG_19490 [Sporichthyaceae bacterium]
MLSRTFTRTGIAAGSLALFVAGTAFAAAPAGASGSAAALEADDSRAAKAKAGVPTTCKAAGLTGKLYGKKFDGSKPAWADPTEPLEWDEGTIGANNLDVLFVREGFKLNGIAVVALDEKNYNVYTEESLGARPDEGWLNLHPPKAKKGTAKIKHWFVCADKA